MSGPDPKDSAAKAQVVGFPVVLPEEVKHRALVAAQDLARSDRPAGEWKLYYVDIAGRYGIPPAEFAAVIEEIIAQRKKQGQEAKAQDREREQRVERERITARREQKQECWGSYRSNHSRIPTAGRSLSRGTGSGIPARFGHSI